MRLLFAANKQIIKILIYSIAVGTPTVPTAICHPLIQKITPHIYTFIFNFLDFKKK